MTNSFPSRRSRDLEALCERWRDEDGDALANQLAQGLEELVDRAGHEHSRRLVEDQDAGAPIEHLQYLDALAIADAELLDHAVGVDGHAVGLADLADASAGGVAVESQALAGLRAQHHVLEAREVVGQHEIASASCVARVCA